MNATSDQKTPLSPNDPAYYAPRVPRDADPTRLPALGETRAYRPPATSITDTTLEGQLENAVFESLRHPLDPEAVEEPAEDRRAGFLGVVGRVATAIGAAAFVALLFVIVIPSLRQQSGDPSAAEVIDSMKSALSKSELAARPQEPQPQASPELQSIQASPSEGGPQVSHEESEVLLKQFMQWQQKPAEAQEKP